MLSFGGDSAEDLEKGDKKETSEETTKKESMLSKFIGTSEKVSKNKTGLDGLELKQARLWTRVDELELKIQKQAEKIKVLEQGLMLGVVPNSPKEEAFFGGAEVAHSRKMNVLEKALEFKEYEKKEGEKKSDVTQTPEAIKQEFVEKMKTAKELYRSGKYGKAYLIFSKVDKMFADNITHGAQKYWLGRCWYKLKENQSAQQFLTEFITSYSKSPLVASAQLYLAKVELAMGLQEQAIARLRSIVKDHPYESSSEAAEQMLSNMYKAL